MHNTSIFQAITDANIVPKFNKQTKRKLKIMISFPYREGNMSKLVKEYRPMISSLALDSGAFSVFTKKKSVNLKVYGIFLRKFGDPFDLRFTLDDKFDDAYHNLQNQLELEEMLKDKTWKPIPVVHDFDDPFKEFELYVNNGHDYIALGSMGERQKIPNKILDKIRQKYPDIKIHMFGTLNLDMLMEYRPESADSSGWAQGAGNGSIYYWNHDENKAYSYNVGAVDSKTNKKELVKDSPFYKEIVAFWENTLKLTPEEVVSEPEARYICNLYFFTQVEEYLNSPDSDPKARKKATKKS